jgi:hypothetical protein
MSIAFRYVIGFCIVFYVPILSAYGFRDQDEADNFEIEYVGLKKKNKVKNENNNKGSLYAETRDTLEMSIVNDYIPNIIAVYYIAKWEQSECTASAVACGAVSSVGIAFAPLTFGISLIASAPGTALCVMSSVMAHRYKKLKRRAKFYLRADLNPHLFQQLIQLCDTADLLTIKEFLHKEGFDVQNMIKR